MKIILLPASERHSSNQCCYYLLFNCCAIKCPPDPKKSFISFAPAETSHGQRADLLKSAAFSQPVTSSSSIIGWDEHMGKEGRVVARMCARKNAGESVDWPPGAKRIGDGIKGKVRGWGDGQAAEPVPGCWPSLSPPVLCPAKAQ